MMARELDAGRTVWMLPGTSTGGDAVLHLGRGCTPIRNSRKAPLRLEAGDRPDLRVCSRCAGEAAEPGGYDPDASVARALERMDPEDLGLGGWP